MKLLCGCEVGVGPRLVMTCQQHDPKFSLRDEMAQAALGSSEIMELADRIVAPEDKAYDEIDRAGRFQVSPAEIVRRVTAAAYVIADGMLVARAAKGGA